ncbi:G-BOX-BINDING FACTOR 3-RELATED [Salix purpurea]|uniref:G-BOX-BINDING FACTOR 3-RELATED n=1 Tax=Salix purpurea TaxID=77065 RepID=A0A9Q0WZE7_SALPP|nr:G-BOX-BINDING FACTOR 3-RELATED [Salix purpurea]
MSILITIFTTWSGVSLVSSNLFPTKMSCDMHDIYKLFRCFIDIALGEESIPAKSSKPASSNQEIPTTPSYPDWSNSMQAYYGAGATPPPFFASTVASPSPHPYLWGSQHPLIPPYGTPVPYPALYTAAGVYAHPNMALTPNTAQANTELEGKVPDGKDRASAKKAKGTSGGKAVESGKAISDSGNDCASQSAESGTDGSSDASDENNNQQEYAANKKRSFNQMLADANAQSNSAEANIQTSVPGKPVVSTPATNLNIGMDLWNASPAAAGATKMTLNPSGASSGAVPAGMSEQWTQDERELKRQKRKQSNRESARRSRLRKQAECEELQARVDNLNNDNRNLRDELQSLSEDCNKLKSENDSIKEELTRLYGPEAVANLEQTNPVSDPKSHGGEGNS